MVPREARPCIAKFCYTRTGFCFNIMKDFNLWHKRKNEINNSNKNVFYHEREVWWCSLGLNIGFEQDGKGEDFSRPVLIIKGFSKNVFLCVPLTTRNKEGKHYHSINLKDGVERKVILSQLRLVDSKRLKEKIQTLDEKQFIKIKNAITKLIE